MRAVSTLAAGAAESGLGTTASRSAPGARARRPEETSLLHHRADRRQVAIVAIYWALLGSMYFVPACRNVLFLLLACYFSFLNAVVIHNHLHKGIFKSKTLNRAFRAVLSFGNLYAASANIASHNLVHHHFDDDGQPDWADPHWVTGEGVAFRWHLLNLIHFPNVAGPNTFAGVSRWAKITRQRDFRRQYVLEQIVAFGLTAALLAYDFWTALFFLVIPQLWGARGILRINLIQHDGCDTGSEWNHSRNFVGRVFNWIMCNNGYHTIHHNRAGLHWSVLDEVHRKECAGRIDPALDEPSMTAYLLRTFVLRFSRPEERDVAATERASTERVRLGQDGERSIELPSREARRAEVEAAAFVD
ncbi:MAG: fatty acid desaturase [Myxococcota bacterium]|nr:fatty acid desaturase [Myxococcota bacterium]